MGGRETSVLSSEHAKTTTEKLELNSIKIKECSFKSVQVEKRIRKLVQNRLLNKYNSRKLKIEDNKGTEFILLKIPMKRI